MKDSNNKVAIVCDGTEITYGMGLVNLLKYVDDNNTVLSKKGKTNNVEIYSIKVFERSGVSKDTDRVFFGKVSKKEGDRVYEKYGMEIWKKDKNIYCIANTNVLNGKVYDEFLTYAEQKRNDYTKSEADYISEIDGLALKFINNRFVAAPKKGLFGSSSNDKKKLAQQYACLSYVIYDEYL